MTSELLASVCQSGKSSLANASLLASRFGKNRHCWKNAFPHCCVWIRSSLDKVFPATELRPFFFKHVFDAALSIVGVGILQTILRKKQRNGHLEAQDRSCRPETQWNNSKRHFAPRTLAVSVSGGQTDIPKWNCQLQFFANWLDNQMTAAFAGKGYQLGKNKSKVSI